MFPPTRLSVGFDEWWQKKMAGAFHNNLPGYKPIARHAWVQSASRHPSNEAVKALLAVEQLRYRVWINGVWVKVCCVCNHVIQEDAQNFAHYEECPVSRVRKEMGDGS